jgi:biotin synthase
MAHRALLKPYGLTSPVFARACRLSRSFSTVIDAPVHPSSKPAPPQPASTVFHNAVQATGPRNDWTKEEISEVYNTSLIDLTFAAVSIPFPLLPIRIDTSSQLSIAASTTPPQSKCALS